jgi:hypothetical protein
VDKNGQDIHPRWIEATAHAAGQIRQLARKVLRDVWRASELAELSLHAPWRTHGDDFGAYPHLRIARYARWKAADLRCGDWRLRKGMEILLGRGVERLHDPLDYESKYAQALSVDQVREKLLRAEQEEVRLIVDLVLHGCKWDEIARYLGVEPSERNVNTMRRRYRRTIRRFL